MSRTLVLLLALAGCGRHDTAQQTNDDLAPLRAEAAHYVAWAKPLADTAGFVDTASDKCDSLLFSCLAKVGGAGVVYVTAEDPAAPGRWYRDSARSCSKAACNTAADFSRDMAIGLAYCMWQTADVAGAKAFVAYADAHGGQMGEGDREVAAMGPLVRYLFQMIVAKAESTPLPARPEDPDPDTGTGAKLTDLTGFRAHITVLGILLDGLMQGGLTDVEMAIVKNQVARQPRNALYQAVLHKYTDGHQGAALAVLNDTALFPKDRLPASSDRSGYYLWQRDQETDNWQPDAKTQPAVSFSGTDLTFVTAVISGSLREAK